MGDSIIIEEISNRAWLPRNTSPGRYNTGEPDDSALSNVTAGDLRLTESSLIFETKGGTITDISRDNILSVRETELGLPGFNPHTSGIEIILRDGPPSRLLLRVKEPSLWFEHLDKNNMNKSVKVSHPKEEKTSKKISDDLINELKELNEFKEQGILNDEEFKSAKQKLIEK